MGLNEDCAALQTAISNKVGSTVHDLSTFAIAICVAFWRGWKLTLVMVSLTPLIAVAGAAMAKVMSYGTSRVAEAYSNANMQSSQAICNIRTVASFQAEESIYEKYAEMLKYPKKVAIRLTTLGGVANGFTNAIMYTACARKPS
jgi:ABC-type bacteriocin/lantibiotic exporter with double-glycine peptidase domain